MFFKLIKLLIIIAIIFLITMIILEYFIKTISQKELIRISALLTGVISTIFILSMEKIENFEETDIETEEEEVEEQQLKEDIKDDLQTLLDDMVEKVNENDIETEESEPQLSSDTSRTRTELSQEKSGISLDNEIAENQKKVEETALPMEIPSSADAVISKISQETQNKYTLMKIEDWLKPMGQRATEIGCSCPNIPAWGANFMEI